MMELVWTSVTMALAGMLLFLLIVVRGVPLRMGLARMRRRTFLIVDNDTHYTAPGIRREGPVVIETKDHRAFGKAFRIKSLEGIRIGLAVPHEFIMIDPTLAAAVEADNASIDNPDSYVKMEDSNTKVKISGSMVRLSEITKGLEKRRTPTLIKSAMSYAAQEAVLAKEREPAKLAFAICMILIGLGVFFILLMKSGILG